MQSRLRNAVRSVHCIALSEVQTLHGRCCLFGDCLVQSEPIEGRENGFLSACQEGQLGRRVYGVRVHAHVPHHTCEQRQAGDSIQLERPSLWPRKAGFDWQCGLVKDCVVCEKWSISCSRIPPITASRYSRIERLTHLGCLCMYSAES